MQITKLETKDGLYVVNGYVVPKGHWLNELAKKAEDDGMEVTEWVEPVQDPKALALEALQKWRTAGQEILDEVSLILAQKAPSPAEGLANLAALEVVDKLLGRGDLRVAKAALEAADLTGTSFDGDSDSYDYVMGLLDSKIAELTA